MGIKYANELLKDCKSQVSIEQYRNKTIVIDFMTIVVNTKKNYPEDKYWMNHIIKLIDIFKSYNITIICVFDGNSKPKEKNKVIEKRRSNGRDEKQKFDLLKDDYYKLISKDTNQIENLRQKYQKYLRPETNITTESLDNSEHNEISIVELYNKIIDQYNQHNRHITFPSQLEIHCLKKILRYYEIIVIEAEGEGEAVCVQLYKDGFINPYELSKDNQLTFEKQTQFNSDNIIKVDIIYSDDSDILLYNVKEYISGFKKDKKTFNLIKSDVIANKHNIPEDKFLLFCYCLGNDYDNGLWYTYPNQFSRIQQFIQNNTIESIEQMLQNKIRITYERLKYIFNHKNTSFTIVADVDINDINKLFEKYLGKG